MLIQFNFKNFKSFRDEATLDLSATNLKNYSERVVKIGKEKLLTLAAIYGANASGKSNVYDAFSYMSNYVVQSFMFGDSDDEFEFNNELTPFLFDEKTIKSESSFEVYFTIPSDMSGKVYNYGFCLNKKEITEEWFNVKAKTSKESRRIFYRNAAEKELDLSGIPKNNRDNIKIALDKKVLIASLGSKLKISKCKLVRDWFFSNELVDFGDQFTNFFMQNRIPSNFINDKEIQKKVVNFLATFDGHIRDFKVEKISNTDSKSQLDSYTVSSLHKMIDSDKMAELPLSEESDGTLKMFQLYPDLQKVIEKGSVFFVDELNARLHPLLVRNFLLTFLNPKINKNHAQLIFTTHDTWHLSSKFLREDEIWFVEKDENGLSTLYSLADFSDDVQDGNLKNYEELYLVGRYGAIPKVQLIDFLGGNSDE
ncbi:MAG: AAA family ATPase [Selenomonadaceae bacterium]|nr:AAA family ATPase [Selenomonadaceae bacterium]